MNFKFSIASPCGFQEVLSVLLLDHGVNPGTVEHLSYSVCCPTLFSSQGGSSFPGMQFLNATVVCIFKQRIKRVGV